MIVQDGTRRMLEGQEDVFYYLTVMNENYAHPAMPRRNPQAGPTTEEGILRGMYRFSGDGRGKVQLMGAGTILREVIAAAALLAKDWGIAADVWSVTSFTELRRDGMACERTHMLGGEAQGWVAQCLAQTAGPVVAASDYVRAVADLARPYVPASRRYVSLGTDGFGRSDTRERLRDFFEVDAKHVAVAALAALADDGVIAREKVREAVARYGLDAALPAPWTR